MKAPFSLVLAAAAVLVLPVPAAAERQSWITTHQTTRFEDIVQMSAFADADQGPDRLSLYCDTSNRFRIIILPKRRVLSDGVTSIVLKIDDRAAIVMQANAFAENGDETDVVVPLNTDQVERAIIGAKKVRLHYGPPGQPGADASFTFDNLAAGQADVLKVCPVGR
jgi:hypothetical protein